ncbi:MAG TPA: protein kinase [Candidatus Saccharimonadales bacterium]|nr:protein kinase [Candidatus Saccharimonadales bacterium]
MALSPGTRLGPYEVTAPLGAGGMGEVYRATDAKLGREVAIKILPEEFARQPDRLARFEREAKVLASLNHPNIASIYGLEESEGLRCLILELVEGKTLAEQIDAGPLPVEKAMTFALQMAEALEAAHEKGIVHRDLKPANVKVTPEGTVKVLDFGLAKAFAADSAPGTDTSMSPTLTVAATQAGVIIGTAAYMSPEQAAGQAADQRSDIWSFGVVLVEMLTGRRTFGGETVSHVLASVLKDDPEWDRIPPELPPRLVELLRACLRKKPRRRLQAMGDARVLLEEYLGNPASFEPAVAAEVPATARASRRMQIVPWAIAALLAIGLAGALWGPWGRAPVEERVERLSISGGKGETLFRGYGSSVVVSPDGSTVAYVMNHGGGRQLYLRPLDLWEPRVLVPDDQSSYHPFFSPDGQWVGFVTRTELKKVPVRGGTPITLCTIDRGRGASWGADGTIVFAPSPNSGLMRVPASGGEPQPLTVLDEGKKERSHRWPQILPGGEAVLFTSIAQEGNFDQASLELFIFKTKERRVLHKGGSYGRYVASGHVVYESQGTLFAFPFDLDSLEATGSPAPVLEGVASNRNEGGAQFDVSADGTLVYAVGGSAETGTKVVWVDSSGKAAPLWDDLQDYGSPALSPDGTRLAIEVHKEGDSDIWVYDLARGVPMRLTFDKGGDSTPVWSSDGKWIYYSLQNEDGSGIYRRPADGSGKPEQVLARDKPPGIDSVSRDGKFLVFTDSSDLWLLPLGGGEPQPFQATPATEVQAAISPDGRWVTYNSNESGQFEIYVRPASGEGGKWQISTGGGGYPRWSSDGRTLYFRSFTGSMMQAPVESAGGEFRVGRAEEMFGGPFDFRADGVRRYDVDPGGKRFVMLQTQVGSAEEQEQIRVVLHWFDDLRRTFAQGGGTQ